ncbi:7-deoxyloganetin glucosyltransferase [Quercus suber]|uniref:7-deoxyloganetin glucosyltransferase n=1 Tax=Quercus suber TaxID=58331 RepID=A0AAW0LP45_QUESU
MALAALVQLLPSSIPSSSSSVKDNLLHNFSRSSAIVGTTNTEFSHQRFLKSRGPNSLDDGFMPFTITAARELGIPIVMFFTIFACSLMGDMQLSTLKDKCIIPLKVERAPKASGLVI